MRVRGAFTAVRYALTPDRGRLAPRPAPYRSRVTTTRGELPAIRKMAHRQLRRVYDQELRRS